MIYSSIHHISKRRRGGGAQRSTTAAALALVLLLAYGVANSQQQQQQQDAVDDNAAAISAAATSHKATAAAAKAAAITAGDAALAGAPRPAPQKVRLVAAAAEAEVLNGDDVDPSGACAAFVAATSCRDVALGEGRLAECIGALAAAADAGGDGGGEGAVPAACAAEVAAYHAKRAGNINANLPLARACKLDAEKLCGGGGSEGATLAGGIISCLKDAKDRVSGACKGELKRLARAAAVDLRADPAMRAACAADAARFCAGVEEGGGRVQACLRDNHLKLDWVCAEQLLRAEIEAADDLTLSVRLYARCVGDKRRFCADADAGQAAARDCLVEHRLDDGFTEACRNEVEAMVERRVRDFRLDSRLRKYCAADLAEICGAYDAAGSDDDGGGGAGAGACLQDYAADIRDERCAALVKQYRALAAQDVRFDAPLADACAGDRAALCRDVAPGSARVIRCLQGQRDKLSASCRARLFDEEVKFSENIDFQFPMKKACAKELETYCSKVPHGNARAIRCLQESKGKRDFGRLCLKEVLAYEQRASSDYRLNHRLKAACARDAAALCDDAACIKDSARVCGGAVLRCLTERRDEVKADACRKEIEYFERMEVADYRNDVILAAACRGDVEAFCKGVQPGDEGGVHACLRAHGASLSEACRREELLLEAEEAERAELRPSLLRACSAERGLFCGTVPQGEGRVFRCLVDRLADPDFGPQCRLEVIGKLRRRQANWKLDPALRRACRDDAAQLCSNEDASASEDGRVYRCLARAANDLTAGCRKELGRAVHSALSVWAPGGAVTGACDGDVAELCLKARPNMLHKPGAVRECLADALARLVDYEAASTGSSGGSQRTVSAAKQLQPAPPRLSDECRTLAAASAPPDSMRAFEASLAAAAVDAQLAKLEARAGVSLVTRDGAGRAAGVTLTGWSALAGAAALVCLTFMGAKRAWRAVTGAPSSGGGGGGGGGATVVLKARPQYKAVPTMGA